MEKPYGDKLYRLRVEKIWSLRPQVDGFIDFLKENLGLRRVTTSGRVLPANTKTTINNFIANCASEIQTRQLSRKSIFNMDETTIYLDSKSNYTYDQIGSRRVPAQSSGNEKTRLSVCFCALAFGEKFRVMVIIPRVTPIKDYIPPNNVYIVYSKSGTFNENIISNNFIERCIYPEILSKHLENSVLLLDHAPCHLTRQVKDKLANCNINPIYIPKRLTNMLQPADVSWMRPIKRAFHEKWQNWFLNEEKSFTRSGNLKSPGYEKAI